MKNSLISGSKFPFLPVLFSALILILPVFILRIAPSRSGPAELPEEPVKSFDAFCMDVFRDTLEHSDTLTLHYILPEHESCGIHPQEISFGRFSLEERIAEQHDAERMLEQLESFDRGALAPEQLPVYDTLRFTLRTDISSAGLELYEQPLAPVIGIQAQLPILLAEYAFYSPDDVEEYLTLLSDIDRYYLDILEFQRQKAAAGLGPSDETLDAVIESCKGYLQNPDRLVLLETFPDRIAEMEEHCGIQISEDRYQNLSQRHRAVISDHVLPAYEQLIRGLEELKGHGINDGGLCGWKDGASYFEYLLKSQAGLSCTAEELKTALKDRIQCDLEAIRRLLLRDPDLPQTVLNSRFRLTDPHRILQDLQTHMKEDFPALPSCGYEIPYEIRYVPKALEPVLSPAFYLTPPLNHIDRNIIYINNGSPDGTSGLYTTLAHEGFPGHLYQTVYYRTQTSNRLLPLLGCSAANEGWAVYVETYAYTLDNGLPPGVGEYLAHLRSLSLCVHGMLDIGINYDGWNREQSDAFLSAYFQVDDATAEQLWQTMISTPVNYLEYCGGYAEILDMKEQAQETLGEDFSLMEFHRFLLDTGPLPFPVIREHFRTWLTEHET